MMREEEDPNLTFKPQISANSRDLVESRRMQESDPMEFNVTTRLVADAKKKRASRRYFHRTDSQAAKVPAPAPRNVY